MDVRNCKRCGKMYQFTGNYICNNCVRQDEEEFNRVKQYVIDHPGSSPVEVSQAIGIEIKTITRFLREGRLEAEGLELEMDEGDLVCENCRQPIKTGRFCERCSQQLQQQFKRAAESLEPEKTSPVDKIGAKSNSKDIIHTYDVILKKKQP